jgi:hypothetical protein
MISTPNTVSGRLRLLQPEPDRRTAGNGRDNRANGLRLCHPVRGMTFGQGFGDSAKGTSSIMADDPRVARLRRAQLLGRTAAALLRQQQQSAPQPQPEPEPKFSPR